MLQKIVQKLIEWHESHLKSVNNQNFFIWSLHLTHILIQDSGHNYVECVRPTMDTKCEKIQ